MSQAQAQEHYKKMRSHLTEALGEAIKLLKHIDEGSTAIKLMGVIAIETNNLLDEILEKKKG